MWNSSDADVAGQPGLAQILIARGAITPEQLRTAADFQATTGCPLVEAVQSLRLCDDADLAQALAEQIDMPFIDLEEFPPSPECIALLPRHVALEYSVLPVRTSGHRVLVAVADPYDIRVDAVVQQATHLRPEVAVAPEAQLRELLCHYYSEVTADAPPPQWDEDPTELDQEERRARAEQLVATAEQASTVQVVNTIIADAVRRAASDVHLEPEESFIRIRFRLDGRLRTIVTLKPAQLPGIVARLKIMAGMDITKTRKPQDGAARVRVEGEVYELRVSTLPSVYGETVVVRILQNSDRLLEMDDLGMEAGMLSVLQSLLATSQGIILITGPTGSGKTTTLYAALQHINHEELNIISVEDPIETRLADITQVQVREQAGLTFASALRAMLRQDPDVLMVGEIRDTETAEIACRAALTGHLVLSTVHTQDTLTSAERLLDIGVPAHVLLASLHAILSQRLLGRVCEVCAVDDEPSDSCRMALEAQFGRAAEARFRKGRGCATCSHTGIHGRIGVFELLQVDASMRRLLARDDGVEAVRQLLKTRGFRTLAQDAFGKACQGLVPIEEVLNLGLGPAANQAGTGEENSGRLVEVKPMAIATHHPLPSRSDASRN